MTVGDGIFWAGLIFALVVLFAVTKDRWCWKKIIVFPLLLTVAVGLGVWGWVSYNDRPKVQTELWGIQLGESAGEVVFKKGKPREIVEGKAFKGKTYEYRTDDAGIWIRVSDDKVGAVVVLLGKEHYGHNIQGIYFGSRSEDIVGKFGQPSEIEIDKDEISRIYAYEKYGVVFGLKQNSVELMGIYSQAFGIPVGFGGQKSQEGN